MKRGEKLIEQIQNALAESVNSNMASTADFAVIRSVTNIFCRDFVNFGCWKINCKFIHGTKEEEDLWKRTNRVKTVHEQFWLL